MERGDDPADDPAQHLMELVLAEQAATMVDGMGDANPKY